MNVHLRRMIVSAMFLAIALVIRVFTGTDLPLFGESGLRISIHGIFSFMPAILFGPIYGAVVAGLTDFLGHYLRPSGAYIPYLTLTAMLAGFLRGLLWKLLKNKSNVFMRNIVLAMSLLITGAGVTNMALLASDGVQRGFYEPYTIETFVNEQNVTVHVIDRDRIDTSNMSFIGSMAVNRSIGANNPGNVLNEFIAHVTTTMIGAGILGILFVLIDMATNKYLVKGREGVPTMTLLVALMIPAMLVSLINTEILRYVLPAWRLLPFSVLWLPRIMQAVGTTLLVSYFVAFLLGILKRQPYFREWINV